MILVVTSKRDSHVGQVTQHLDRAGREWVRINTEDLATNVEMSIDPNSGNGSIFVRDSKTPFNLEEVTACWYRKPDAVSVAHFDLDQGALPYVEGEFTELLHGLYASLRDALWINDPFRTRIAHRKMLQLQVARRVGFKTPRSVVTNRVEEALEFAESVAWDVAVKSLSPISVTTESGGETTQFGLFTRRVCKDELLLLQDKIRHMPILLQEYVAKQFELRVTCVGSEIFGCRIDSQKSQLTQEDYRFDTKQLKHTPYDCSAFAQSLREYMRIFQINFACFDFAVTPEGELCFFEANPNGQWLWIEELTALQIGKAIGELLMIRQR